MASTKRRTNRQYRARKSRGGGRRCNFGGGASYRKRRINGGHWEKNATGHGYYFVPDAASSNNNNNAAIGNIGKALKQNQDVQDVQRLAKYDADVVLEKAAAEREKATAAKALANLRPGEAQHNSDLITLQREVDEAKTLVNKTEDLISSAKSSLEKQPTNQYAKGAVISNTNLLVGYQTELKVAQEKVDAENARWAEEVAKMSTAVVSPSTGDEAAVAGVVPLSPGAQDGGTPAVPGGRRRRRIPLGRRTKRRRRR